VIQETLEEFRVRYVAGVSFQPTHMEQLRANLRKFFPADVHWEFEQVTDIERERSGKTRFRISRVSREVTIASALNL